MQKSQVSALPCVSAKGAPPANPFDKPLADPVDPTLDDEKTNLGEGPVLLRWPKEISKASFEELEYWINGAYCSLRPPLPATPTGTPRLAM